MNNIQDWGKKTGLGKLFRIVFEKRLLCFFGGLCLAHLIVLFKAVVYRHYCFYLEMSVGLLPTIVIS